MQIAQIIKPKGLQGQFVAEACPAYNGLFASRQIVGLEVWIVPPSLRGLRFGKIEDLVQKPGSRDFMLRMTGVQDLTAASELVGRYLLAKLDGANQAILSSAQFDADLAASTNSAVAAPELNLRKQNAGGLQDPDKSLSFLDLTAGSLGRLVRIDQTPAYDLWVVDGPHGELLIPAVEAYVVQATPELITLNLPKGFLEINKRSSPQ